MSLRRQSSIYTPQHSPSVKMPDLVSVMVFYSHKIVHTVEVSLCLTDVLLHQKSRLQNSFIKSGRRASVGVSQSGHGVTKLQQGFVVRGGGFVISPAS